MNTGIFIANLLIQETGTYNTQVCRPYEANTRGDVLDTLGRRIESCTQSDPLTKISGNLISGLSGNLIYPSANYEREVIIPNGWNEHRLRFMLEVHVKTNFGVQVYYFQGYTDHIGISLNGTIDPNMPFFINSFVQVNRSADASGLGMYGFRDVVAQSAQIIDGVNYMSPQMYQQNGNVYGLRPEDLFTGIHSSYLNQGVNYDGINVINETRIGQAKEVFTSRRTNAIPSRFLSNVVENYRNATHLADYGNGTDDIYARAIQTTHEGSPYETPFVRALSDLHQVPCRSFFTMNDLVMLDPNAANQTTYQSLQQTVRLHQAGDTDSNWTAATMETQIATTLTHSISALMLNCMLVSVGFHCTNMTLDRHVETKIFPNAQGITNVNLQQHFFEFVRVLESEIMPDITNNGMFDVDIQVLADLYGETQIDISLNGASHEVFVTPSFCDALMAPVVTVNRTTFDELVHGVEEIVNTCTPSQYNNQKFIEF